MDDDFDFDESLFQAVDRLESNYKSQVAQNQAKGLTSLQSQETHLTARKQHGTLQQLRSAPLQQAQSANSEMQCVWQLFASQQPLRSAANAASVCTGWASKRLQQRSGSWGRAAANQKAFIQQAGLIHTQVHTLSSNGLQQHHCQQPDQLHQQPPQQPEHPAPDQQRQQQTWQPSMQQKPLPQCHQPQQPWQSARDSHLEHQQWQQQHAASYQGPTHMQQRQHHLQPHEWHHHNHHQQQQLQPLSTAQPQPVGQSLQQQNVTQTSAALCQPQSGSSLAAGAGSGSSGIAGKQAMVPALQNQSVAAMTGEQPFAHDPAAQSGMGPPHQSTTTAAASKSAVQTGRAAEHAGGSSSSAAVAGSAGPAGSAPGGSAAAAAGVSGQGAAASGGPARSTATCVYTAKLQLGPKGFIEVEFSGYHQEIATACGSIPGAKQVGERWSRKWQIPSDKMQQLEAKLKEGASVSVPRFEPLPDFVNKFTTAARKQPDDCARYQCLTQLMLAPTESLEQRMMSFQREGVQFGLRAGGRVLVGDEMGLGKTVQACALAKCYQDEWPALVVAPSSLRLSWQAALYDWIRVVEDRVLVVLKKTDMNRLANAPSEQAARSMFDFVVVGYDMLKDLYEVLEAMEFKVVILDESHCIKNPTAQRTKLALPLVKGAKRCIMLSGTPALSRPTELFTQLQGLLPKAGITKKAFEDRYAVYSHFGNFPKLTGSKNEDELNKLLTSTVMIRRKKQEVLKDLPAKLRKQVLLMLPPKKRAELDNLKQQLSEVRKLTADIHGVGRAVGGGLLQGMQEAQRTMIMHLYHATAQLKADTVAEYVIELLDTSHPDDKFLVFAFHSEMMNAIECGVSNAKRKNKDLKDLQHMRIDGSTPAQQRQRNVERFQEEANCRVAILNIKAAGVGLTLTRASTVVFAELAWTPSEVQQAEDRAHRIGQTQCVNVQLLLVKDSIDEIMWELLQNKLATTGQVLDGQKDKMEIEKSANHRTKSGWTSTQQDSSQVDNQASIKDFFGAASKKQRVQ